MLYLRGGLKGYLIRFLLNLEITQLTQTFNNQSNMANYTDQLMAVLTDVKTQLETGKDKFGEGEPGVAYIDWGVLQAWYQNCPNKEMADRVAEMMQQDGYKVYIRRLGRCNMARLPEGTISGYWVLAPDIKPHREMDEYQSFNARYL